MSVSEPEKEQIKQMSHLILHCEICGQTKEIDDEHTPPWYPLDEFRKHENDGRRCLEKGEYKDRMDNVGQTTFVYVMWPG